ESRITMKKVFLIIALVLAAGIALILTLSFGASARGTLMQQAVVIDFENLAPGRVSNQYANLGVIFNQPTALNYQNQPGFAHSGVNAIEQCYSREFCNTPIEMSFTSGQRRVKVWVGYSSNLETSQTVILRALDAAGAQIGQSTVVLNPSFNPQAIRTPLEVV